MAQTACRVEETPNSETDVAHSQQATRVGVGCGRGLFCGCCGGCGVSEVGALRESPLVPAQRSHLLRTFAFERSARRALREQVACG